MKKNTTKLLLLFLFTFFALLLSCEDLTDTGTGTGVEDIDAAQLKGAIEAAAFLKDDTAVGTAAGQVSAETSSAFSDAIGKAETVRDNPDSTQDALNKAYADLLAAEKAFKEAIIADSNTVDTSELDSDIEAAAFRAGRTGIGIHIGMVSSEDFATYQAAIDSARNASNDLNKTEETIAQAIKDLEAATAQFEKDIIKGPILSLIGTSSMEVVQGSVFTDQGAAMVDDKDKSETIFSDNAGDVDVNASAETVYTLTYNFTDSDGNAAAEITRTVKIVALLGNPLTAAPTPAEDLNSAIVIYSDAKDPDVADVNFLAEWSTEDVSREEVEIISGNNAMKYKIALGFGGPTVGIELYTNPNPGDESYVPTGTDVSGKARIHFDIFVQGDVEIFKMKLISPGGGAGYASMLDNYFIEKNGGYDTWISIDLALADIPTAPGALGPADYSELIQIVFITYGKASTVSRQTQYFIDNLYFY